MERWPVGRSGKIKKEIQPEQITKETSLKRWIIYPEEKKNQATKQTRHF